MPLTGAAEFVEPLEPFDECIELALRFATENVPNPTSRTSSPSARAFWIASKTPSTAFEASLLERPQDSATAPISSFLFIR